MERMSYNNKQTTTMKVATAEAGTEPGTKFEVVEKEVQTMETRVNLQDDSLQRLWEHRHRSISKPTVNSEEKDAVRNTTNGSANIRTVMTKIPPVPQPTVQLTVLQATEFRFPEERKKS